VKRGCHTGNRSENAELLGSSTRLGGPVPWGSPEQRLMVEHLLRKQRVAGSIPVFRSNQGEPLSKNSPRGLELSSGCRQPAHALA
jgi:hypothetical protein